MKRCLIRRCCERPAPMAFVVLSHARGDDVAAMDPEVWWWFQCWSCGYICTCEV